MAAAVDEPLRFYTVTDRRYFVGAVGLVNSVAATGHTAPFTVVDGGLDPAQRACLEEAGIDLVRPPEGTSGALVKGYGQIARPARVMVFLDADMVCVRHLGEVIDAAGDDGLAFVEDPPGRPHIGPDLWATWADRLRLADVEPAPYFNTGIMVAAGETGRAFLAEMQDLLLGLDPGETFNGRLPHVDATWPFYYADQDVANPLAATARYRAKIARLPAALAPMPPFTGVRLGRGGTEDACTGPGGAKPLVLHHAWAKPWLEPLPLSPFTVLLRRAVCRPEGPVHAPAALLPPAFRAGAVGSARLALRSARGSVRSRVRGKLGLRRRLAARRSRRASTAS